MARQLTPADVRAMHHAKAQRAASSFALRLAERKRKARISVFATSAVELAMKNGLEWAVKNPRPFLQEGGAVVDGSSLTAEEQDAVVEVLQNLLDRLVERPGMLWKARGRSDRGTKRRKTIEREAAEAGARRGW